ncbi:MAG: carboxymuconolactone decarboxylase family protein [Gammaproteobacteria bacterium]|nr:carboxymuconolactone decarboxylase family protein [Gammaproteobacteria bacterium]MBQ0840056.1 carboxymuconolactone decarboxylase family protein [Gammaproteobacteria bacterium]
MSFTLYTPDTAPQAARDELKNSVDSFGWVPNLHAVLAEAPPVLAAYKNLHGLFQQSSFDAQELTVVWQSINLENACHYCVPAHTAIAGMMEVDSAIINSLLEGKVLPTEKLEVLKLTTEALLKQRGDLDDAQIQRFEAVGYGNQQFLEIILGIAQKTISNFTNKLAHTPLDDQFK